MLALNASIESARAGSAGKEFSVIATEVRNLSQSIKSLMTENSVKAQEIVPRINKGLEEIHSLIDNVEILAEKMSTIAASTEEIAAQTEMLNGLADDLRNSVKLLSTNEQ